MSAVKPGVSEMTVSARADGPTRVEHEPDTLLEAAERRAAVALGLPGRRGIAVGGVRDVVVVLAARRRRGRTRSTPARRIGAPSAPSLPPSEPCVAQRRYATAAAAIAAEPDERARPAASAACDAARGGAARGGAVAPRAR